MFDIILITDINGGISKEGKIPWNFSEDMQYFMHKTMYGVVIMGRKTFETFSSPLPNRVHIVITRNPEQSPKDGVYFVKNFQEAYDIAKSFCKAIWVIGGKEIYNISFRHYALDKIYKNVIEHDFECDNNVHFNNIQISVIGEGIFKNKVDGNFYNLQFQLCKRIHNTVEHEYLSLCNKILTTGELRQSRSGNTISLFSHVLNVNLSHGFPLLTTKKMFWKGIVEELLFFIRGETNSKKLSEKGVKIWEGNTTKEFLQKLNLPYEEGQMGPMYGYQWRFFNKPLSEKEGGIDQLSTIIDEIRRDSYSRRLVMTDFNPLQVNQGVLYPCHSLILQFYVNKNKELSCNMYQRSADVFLGLPFNIASTSLLTHIIAQLTDLKPGHVHIHLGDCHIYEEHIPQVKEQLSRIPFDFPTIQFPPFKTIQQVEESSFSDYVLTNYESHPLIKAEMKV